ncbi:GlcG/HbpS family heme-binding protein [Nocardia jiangxiensis]|uniref:Heme-binding protein n=1 Tax=Nocardia jiangxiensis TaxID=282685 RepID=A0ABW6SCC9_9NOCA|nr:heme-binding protein [Nocardia jiangxiensis]
MLTLEQASGIADGALAAARGLELRPLAVTVLDLGGNPIVTVRQDNAGILRHDIAHAKAWGCLGMVRGGGGVAAHAERTPIGFTGISAISGGRLAPARGGVLIRDADGNILGAVGVSGDSPDNDEKAGIAGIVNVGLIAGAG